MFKRLLINFALRILKAEVIDKVQYPAVTGFLGIAFNNLESAAGIVTDNDPNNAEQFKALWRAEKKTILLGAIDTTKAVIVEEVENTQVETYFVAFLDELHKEVEAGTILKKVAA